MVTDLVMAEIKFLDVLVIPQVFSKESHVFRDVLLLQIEMLIVLGEIRFDHLDDFLVFKYLLVDLTH